MPFVSGSRASQKALTPKQNNPVRLAVFYFKRNREGKGLVELRCQKIVLLWGGFHLLVLFFRVGCLANFVQILVCLEWSHPHESYLLCLKGDEPSSRTFVRKGICSVWVAFESIINI